MRELSSFGDDTIQSSVTMPQFLIAPCQSVHPLYWSCGQHSYAGLFRLRTALEACYRRGRYLKIQAPNSRVPAISLKNTTENPAHRVYSARPRGLLVTVSSHAPNVWRFLSHLGSCWNPIENVSNSCLAESSRRPSWLGNTNFNATAH